MRSALPRRLYTLRTIIRSFSPNRQYTWLCWLSFLGAFSFIHNAGRTRRRRKSFACRVVYKWSRLPLSVAAQIQTTSRPMCLLKFCSLFHFLPNVVFFGRFVPSRSVNTYMHTMRCGILTTPNFTIGRDGIKPRFHSFLKRGFTSLLYTSVHT